MRSQIKTVIEENRWLKGIPNLLTIGNSLCGFGAILYSLHVYSSAKELTPRILTLSAFIVLFAMVFDALDGFTARLFNAASMRGLQMDSLADMVTFGVAPAVIVAVMAHRMKELSGGEFYFVWIMCAVYLACAAFRLATYNVHAMVEKKSSDKFDGLPTPGAAAAVCSLVIFFNATSAEHMLLITALPIYAGLLGVLMVSKVRYQHAGKWLQSVRRNRRRLAVLILCLALCYFFNPVYVGVVVVNAYILSGPLGAFFRLFASSANEAVEEADAKA